VHSVPFSHQTDLSSFIDKWNICFCLKVCLHFYLKKQNGYFYILFRLSQPAQRNWKHFRVLLTGAGTKKCGNDGLSLDVWRGIYGDNPPADLMNKFLVMLWYMNNAILRAVFLAAVGNVHIWLALSVMCDFWC